MSYQALYRTYRPARFSDLIGQEPIVTTLTNQIASGRISHAYLFCGSRGTGKTTTAKLLARAVNCLNPQNGDPCGECEACASLSAENNLDIVEIDAASNNGVDEIRDLRDKIKYAPSVGRYKVYIIDEVHMLSTGAFNALLKTLEEPPAHAVFILATTEPQRLPATILSRCQRYDFKRISAKLIEELLRKVVTSQNAEADDEALAIIARAAEGGMRDALSMLDLCLSYQSNQSARLDAALVREVLGSTDRTTLFDFAEALIAGDAGGAFTLIDHVMREGRDPAVFTREVTDHLRSLLLALHCPQGLDDLLEITPEDAARFRAQAQTASQPQLTRQMGLFIEAESDLKWSSTQRAILELCAARACHPERERTVDALEARIASLEKVVERGVSVASVVPSASKPAPQAASQEAASAPESIEFVAPEPQADPPWRPPVSEEDDAQRFQKALKALGRQNVNLLVSLKKGKFAGIEGDAARIEFFPADEIHQEILSQGEKCAAVEACLSEVFERPLRAVFAKRGADKEKEKPSVGNRQLEQAFDLFGRENVTIVDDESQGG